MMILLLKTNSFNFAGLELPKLFQRVSLIREQVEVGLAIPSNLDAIIIDSCIDPVLLHPELLRQLCHCQVPDWPSRMGLASLE